MRQRHEGLVARLVALLVGILMLCTTAKTTEASMNTPPNVLDPNQVQSGPLTVSPASTSALDEIIPMPVSVKQAEGAFSLLFDTKIVIPAGDAGIKAVAQYLADKLHPATGFDLQVVEVSGEPAKGSIVLTTKGADSTLGTEGYDLTVSPDQVLLVANDAEGLFRGIQTIRQMLPAAIDSQSPQPGRWEIPAATIHDYPRFVWRGAMLDVARHFFKLEDVKHYIDLLAYYKLNRFHLHLSDDQGWRIEIKAWPNLTTTGSKTEVGGGEGGFYTQDQYKDLVAYAQARYITIIPEIDMPGHTNAALASYAELNCGKPTPSLYTGTEVGFSSLCANDENTYNFVDDVVKELAALTPGPYIHIGGDEAKSTNSDDYIKFVSLVQDIVKSHGKQMMGWEEIAKIKLLPTTVAQQWNSGPDADALSAKVIQQGAKLVMSPASKAYLDMKYDHSTPLGLNWAGYVSVQAAYSWDPASYVNGVSEKDILGVEAPLWSETLVTLNDIEYMAFPRILGYAEMGWTPQSARDWTTYEARLGAQGPRLTAMGVNFYAAPEVDWQQ